MIQTFRSQFAYQAAHPAASFDPNFPPARAFVAPQHVPADAANVIPNEPRGMLFNLLANYSKVLCGFIVVGYVCI